MKVTVQLADGTLGHIKEVCNCDRCKERGEAEFRLHDERGYYVGYIKFHELFNTETIQRFNPYELCEMLHEKLIEKEETE